MFDDGCAGTVEFFREQRGGLNIHDIVERQFFAVKFFEQVEESAVKRSVLMRILAVAQIHAARHGNA